LRSWLVKKRGQNREASIGKFPPSSHFSGIIKGTAR
jgi:hypothetical protein